MISVRVKSFDDWRERVRQLRCNEIPPEELLFLDGNDAQRSLLDSSAASSGTGKRWQVPREFLAVAQNVAHHRDKDRWAMLYRVFWRLTTSEPDLWQIVTDFDVRALTRMSQAVDRDAHKMQAFVRFRRIIVDGVEHYIAWHRPDHRVLRKLGAFFAGRFSDMHWTIFTPDESATWNCQELTYGTGVPQSEAPQEDELEKLWNVYYANIFNPARVNLRAMKAEMPVRYWPTLPEAKIIGEMLQAAPTRVAAMLKHTEGFAANAASFLPAEAQQRSLPELAAAATHCQACELYRCATQVVFGEGSVNAKIVIVGEQPGDQEDLAGRPFVGPAGELLNRALAAVGLERSRIYITNAVKHFKFEPRGKQRLHKKPSAREIRACKPWFVAEWQALEKPQVLVCLGATAASALIHPSFRVTASRGQFVRSDYCENTIATWHPAAILRAADEERRNQMHQGMCDTFQLARDSCR